MQEEPYKIEVKCRLNADLFTLKKQLSSIPNLKIIKDQNKESLHYGILEKDGKRLILNANIHFSTDLIAISYTKITTNMQKTYLLIKFLSIASYLQDLYIINLQTIYPLIIESLSYAMFFERQINPNQKIATLDAQLAALNSSYIEISSKIVEMNTMHQKELDSLRIYNDFFIQLYHAMAGKDKNPKIAEESFVALGISRIAAQAAISKSKLGIQ